MGKLTRYTDGELEPYLVRFGQRLRLLDGWNFAQGSAWMACLGVLLGLLAGRVWPLAQPWLWVLLPLLVWLLVVLGWSLLRPLPMLKIARRLDLDLGLKERLSTAVILQEKNAEMGGGEMGRSHSSSLPAMQSSLITRQYDDALQNARAIVPRRAFPLHWQRKPLLLAGTFLAAAMVLAWIPNPMDAVRAERAEVAAAAENQAERIEELSQEIEASTELTPEEREELARLLSELAERLRANPGDKAQAMADLSRAEEDLRRRLDANASARQAALEALAAQLQSMAGVESGEKSDPSNLAEAMEQLAERIGEMTSTERQETAQSLAQMAARAAQAGDPALAQALAAMAQAAQAGDSQSASQAAQAGAQAFSQAQTELASQAAIQRALSQLQSGRQSLAQAGQGQARAQAPGEGQPGQGEGQSGEGQPGEGQSQGQGQGQGQSQGQGQGQGQGQAGSSGGGTRANTLPPATGSGQAGSPQGPGGQAGVSPFDSQVYVPWERLQGDNDPLFIPGQETNQGETQVREGTAPLPGAPNPALMPYQAAYYNYLDTANQAIEQSYIPAGLKDYVREYFSQLEP